MEGEIEPMRTYECCRVCGSLRHPCGRWSDEGMRRKETQLDLACDSHCCSACGEMSLECLRVASSSCQWLCPVKCDGAGQLADRVDDCDRLFTRGRVRCEERESFVDAKLT